MSMVNITAGLDTTGLQFHLTETIDIPVMSVALQLTV